MVGSPLSVIQRFYLVNLIHFAQDLNFIKNDYLVN